MKYQVAVVMTVDASSYEEALETAESIVDGVPWGKAPFVLEMSVMRGHDYDHDGSGSRVLYLHPENKPLQEDGSY